MNTILVVEDDDLVRDIIAQKVELMGFNVIKARDGLRAYHILEDNEQIDLVITDVAMPEMDGLTLIKKIKANEQMAGLPIIISSGVVGPREIAEVLDVGATAFIPKPIRSGDLEDYICRYLKKPRLSNCGH
ncbi:MAG: response regulator [Deltaproteobacteria bacterium]|nr:response regulator [Deltaproteobacteria bacterium]